MKFAKFKCNEPKNTGKNVTINFSNVFLKNLILGGSGEADPIIRNETTEANQKHDLRLVYKCESTFLSSWIV
jgi:hypothetical protein